MKNLKTNVSIFILFTCIIAGLQAQDHKSKISFVGLMTDENGNKIGTIKANGTFKDMNGVVIGKCIKNSADSSKHDYFDKTGKKLGTILYDGIIKDLNGNKLYTISVPDAKGNYKVYDSFGKECGLVHRKHKHKSPSKIHNVRPRPTDEPYYPHPEKH